MIVAKVIGIWLLIGFVVASFNQLIFKLRDNADPPRELIFSFTMIIWPLILTIDVLVVAVRSMSWWLNFLEDIPETIRGWKRRKLAAQERKRGIEA